MTSPVVDSLTNIASVLPGEHVACALSPAHDWDRWQNGDIAGTANFAWVEDSPLTYSWSATRGSFLVGEGEDAQLQDHADTREAVWVAPADGSGGVATLTCVVDDAAGDRIGDPLTEVGSRNDDALTRTVTVEVVPSYWSAKDKEIGYHPRRDENNQIIEPHQWLPDGRMTAPLDQTVETPKTEKSVAPGELVPCAVELAEDWDTLTTKDGKSISKDDTLTYTWSSGEKGHFLVPDPDGGPPTQAATATGTSATWIAPDDITEDTEVELKCTIDDATGARVTVPVGGSHDDAKVERTAKIKVLVPKVTLTKMDGTDLGSSGARSCAGGVAVDGVHDFIILATAKLSDGTLVKNAEFKLSFEGNKGVSKRATFIPDTQKEQELISDTHGEEMKVKADSKGQFPLHVLSSDTISSAIKIKVKSVSKQGQEVDAGEQICNFVPVLNYRRFGIADEEGDSGWKFDQALLFEGRGNISPAKFWIKIQKNPSTTIDFQLLEEDGITPRQPNDWDNWLGVGDHHLTVRIDQVVLLDGTAVEPERFSDYITLLTAEGGTPTEEVETQSRSDGSNQVWLKSGENIEQCKFVGLVAYELTQSME